MDEQKGWAIVIPPKQEAVEIRERTAGALRNEPEYFQIPARKEVGDWMIRGSTLVPAFYDGHQRWLADRSRLALIALRDHVEINHKKLGGIPVIRGTRFSVAQLLAELADSDAVGEVADEFELDAEKIRLFLHAMAVYLNRPIP